MINVSANTNLRNSLNDLKVLLENLPVMQNVIFFLIFFFYKKNFIKIKILIYLPNILC